VPSTVEPSTLVPGRVAPPIAIDGKATRVIKALAVQASV
jgi:hypothetical protein